MSRGGCAPLEMEKNYNFQSQFAQFGAFFLPGVPTQSQVPFLCKKIEGMHAGVPPPPLNPPPLLYFKSFAVDRPVGLAH